MKPDTQRALEGALLKLGVPIEDIAENPTKAGMRFVFGVPSPSRAEPLPISLQKTRIPLRRAENAPQSI